jgi:Domain of unknown function (DUF4157)
MLTTHDHQAPDRRPAAPGRRPAPPVRIPPGSRQTGQQQPGHSLASPLQRSLGNAWIQRSLAEEERRDDGCGCGGGCGGCGSGRVQAKPVVGPAGDAFEQEADRVAERVVTMGGAETVAPASPITVQRLPAAPDGGGTALDTDLPTAGGAPLAPATRAYMEPRFGQGFGEVRLHTGGDAHRLAVRIGARAFTQGSHVYLRNGESEHDHRLLAHELTHVVQQRGGTGRESTAAASVQRAVSPELDRVDDYLSYGLFDWAVTDDDALRALALLKTLPRSEQAAFFAEGSYAARLRDNLPQERLPELDALAAAVAGMLPPAPAVEAVQGRLSYGLFDWAITDQDAVEALEMLKRLSGVQLATALDAIDYGRLLDNLPEARKPELAELYTRGLAGSSPADGAAHPGGIISSVTFRSDHGVMKDNTADWTSSGRPYGEPEWYVAGGAAVSRPVSQTRNTPVEVELGFDTLTVGAPAGPVRITGRSPESALTFDFTGTLRGGLRQSLVLTSTGRLPDTVTALADRPIDWEVEWRGWKHDALRTSHTLYVTDAAPLAPDEVTEKRMRTAVQLIGKVAQNIGSLDPHPLVAGVMDTWGAYNLQVQLANPWALADDLARGAQCIDIVRFVQALLVTVGTPGTATAVLVWAYPGAPTVAQETPPSQGGLHAVGPHPAHPDWFAGLMDANGCPNAFEAALRFDHGGVRRYYPGGVDQSTTYTNPTEVLHVFQCFAWLTQVAQDEFDIQAIATTYPGGTCAPGRVRCRH